MTDDGDDRIQLGRGAHRRRAGRWSVVAALAAAACLPFACRPRLAATPATVCETAPDTAAWPRVALGAPAFASARVPRSLVADHSRAYLAAGRYLARLYDRRRELVVELRASDVHVPGQQPLCLDCFLAMPDLCTGWRSAPGWERADRVDVYTDGVEAHGIHWSSDFERSIEVTVRGERWEAAVLTAILASVRPEPRR